jgi:hypothetical protein
LISDKEIKVGMVLYQAEFSNINSIMQIVVGVMHNYKIRLRMEGILLQVKKKEFKVSRFRFSPLIEVRLVNILANVFYYGAIGLH